MTQLSIAERWWRSGSISDAPSSPLPHNKTGKQTNERYYLRLESTTTSPGTENTSTSLLNHHGLPRRPRPRIVSLAPSCNLPATQQQRTQLQEAPPALTVPFQGPPSSAQHTHHLPTVSHIKADRSKPIDHWKPLPGDDSKNLEQATSLTWRGGLDVQSPATQPLLNLYLVSHSSMHILSPNSSSYSDYAVAP